MKSYGILTAAIAALFVAGCSTSSTGSDGMMTGKEKKGFCTAEKSKECCTASEAKKCCPETAAKKDGCCDEGKTAIKADAKKDGCCGDAKTQAKKASCCDGKEISAMCAECRKACKAGACDDAKKCDGEKKCPMQKDSDKP